MKGRFSCSLNHASPPLAKRSPTDSTVGPKVDCFRKRTASNSSMITPTGGGAAANIGKGLGSGKLGIKDFVIEVDLFLVSVTVSVSVYLPIASGLNEITSSVVFFSLAREKSGFSKLHK